MKPVGVELSSPAQSISGSSLSPNTGTKDLSNPSILSHTTTLAFWNTRYICFPFTTFTVRPRCLMNFKAQPIPVMILAPRCTQVKSNALFSLAFCGREFELFLLITEAADGRGGGGVGVTHNTPHTLTIQMLHNPSRVSLYISNYLSNYIYIYTHPHRSYYIFPSI